MVIENRWGDKFEFLKREDASYRILSEAESEANKSPETAVKN